MKNKLVVFWFRRDLRLEDNVALYHALNSGYDVLPIFIFDTFILEDLDRDDTRISFIYDTLLAIQEKLLAEQSSLLIKQGNPVEVFEELTASFNITAVYTNHDYEPYAKQRDAKVLDVLKKQSIQFRTFKDQVIFEKSEVVKQDGTPYKVFTPYAKKWKLLLTADTYKSYESFLLKANFLKATFEFPALKDIGFLKSDKEVFPFDVSQNRLSSYKETRNYPSVEGTSKLSPHLRFGTVSVRYCVREAIQIIDETFLNELIWREFFMQILWHYPESTHNNFKRKYDSIEWRNNEKEFQAWCSGQTGYPIVDAGMRELNNTGYMHNRVRMIVASFLCKHLLIDWRWGEAYFASKLLDFDQAQNVGNWQWVAGTGCDAAPYFRIFNPAEQTKKFDQNWIYINTWVPEYQELTYVQPIVNHKEARERCLKVYKKGLELV